MAREVFIGIDLGTTNLKAAAFESSTGRTLGEASRRLGERLLDSGGREQAPSVIVDALRKAFATLRRQLGARLDATAGIGLAAQGGSGAVVDRADGKALSPMALWNDLAQLRYLPDLAQRYPASFWIEKTLRAGPPRGLARILFLRRHRPELFDRDSLYVGAGEFAFFQLTGVWRQDAGSALQLGGYNATTRALDPELLGVVDLPVSSIAPMRQGHETHPLSRAGARLLGLRPGIPVAGPYMDHEAGYLATLGASHTPLQCSLGTAWVGNFQVPDRAPMLSESQLVLPAVEGEGSLIVQPLICGNTTWDWALGMFGGAGGDALGRAEAIFRKRLLPRPGLVALPGVAMPNPLEPQAPGAAGLFGIDGATDGHEALRALAFAMACEMFRVFEPMSKRLDAMTLGGGAARGGYFRKMLAALFAPLTLREVLEADLAGPRGTLRVFDPKVAAVRTRRVRRPADSVVEAVRAHYASYLRLFERVYGDPLACGRLNVG